MINPGVNAMHDEIEAHIGLCLNQFIGIPNTVETIHQIVRMMDDELESMVATRDITMRDLFVRREQWISDCLHKHGDPSLTAMEQIRDFSLATTHNLCGIGTLQSVMWHGENPIGVYAERREGAGIQCFAYDHVPNELPDGFNRHLLDVDAVNGPVEWWGDD